MYDFKFKLGDLVRDKNTGFTGIIEGASSWLYNCNTYGVRPRELDNGKRIDREWFDEPQLELVKCEQAEQPEIKTGGPTISVPQTNRH